MRWTDGNYAEAERLYKLAIEPYSHFEEAQVGLAGVLLDEKKPTLAVPCLRRATALRPDDEVAWYRLAQGGRQLGDVQAQKSALATFLKLRRRTEALRRSTISTQPQDAVTPQKLGMETQQQCSKTQPNGLSGAVNWVQSPTENSWPILR